MKKQKTTAETKSEIPAALPDRVLIIAETGSAHNGDLSKALELVDAAAESGADCLKTQIIFADEIIHPDTGYVPLPGGSTPLFDVFRSLEQGKDFFLKMKERAEEKGLLFCASPFGTRSLALMREIGCGIIKIASPELNHFPLIREAAEGDELMLLSSGVSTLGDIEKALLISGIDRTILLHCITSYPAPEIEYNVKLIRNLHAVLGVPVGISDHSTNPLIVPSIATYYGAVAIEKHFTLSKEGKGLDDPIALVPETFRQMTDAVREVENLMPKPEDAYTSLCEKFGKDLVEEVSGDGVKHLAPSEEANYTTTNRSIHAARKLKRGEVLGPDNMIILRTEKVLRPGLGPEYYDMLIGKKVKRGVGNGQGIIWDDLF